MKRTFFMGPMNKIQNIGREIYMASELLFSRISGRRERDEMVEENIIEVVERDILNSIVDEEQKKFWQSGWPPQAQKPKEAIAVSKSETS